jgi:chloride channel 7
MIEACNKTNEKAASASQKMEEEEMPDEMTAIKTTRAGIQEDHDDADDQGVSSWLNGIVRDVDPNALPIYRTMDATPYTIMETLPVPRLYPLFIRAHCVASCVLSKEGFFKGLITRSSLINASKVHENPSHKHLSDSDSDSDKEGSDSEENKLPQKVMVSRPRTHHLPSKVILSALFMTVVVIVLTNFCMVMVDSYIVGWKFDTLQSVLSDQGLGIAILFLVSVSGALGCIVAVIVAYVQPVSEIQGSGIPEAKGFINGNVISKYFNPYGHIARVVCMTLAAAAGFPIGREGPMVAIGGMTGYAAAMIVAKPYVRKFIVRDWADSKGGSAFALSIDEERYAHVKLQGFILGAAAGIAVAFNAPIGGILYMFEEVTVTSWPPGFMFYVFSSCAFAVLLSRAMTNLVLDSVFHRLTFYDSDAEGHELYQYIDIPFFIILGALVGTCSALYSKGLFQVWKFRRRKAQELKDFQPFARIAETALYAAVVAGVVMLVPSLVGCHELPVSEAHGHGSGGSSSSGDHSTHGRLLSGGGHGLSYVQYTCPDGSYNEVATLTVTAWEGAIKHLFSPEEGALSMGSLCISVVTYACLAVCMPGLALPMGSFIPSMFIGAMIGRLMGTGLHQVLGLGTSHAGLYAIVGSGAFLGGFTHMTIAIVVLLVEACHDLSFTAPLMIGIFVGRAFSRLVSEHGYDEVLILAKGVPYLDSELPPSLEGADITASSIMQDIPGPAILPEEAPVEVLRAALDEEEVNDFPIVDTNHVCLGTITRGRLEEAVRLHGGMDREQTMRPGFTRRTTRVATEVALDDTNQGAGKYHSSEDQELSLSKVFSKACHGSTIRINRLMDPTPYTILQDMPVARFLLLFTKVGAQTAVIIDKYATFVGLLSRQSFINAMQGAHHHSHKKHDAHHDHKHNKKHHNDDQSDAGSSCYSSDLDTDSPPSPSRKSAGVEHPPPLPPPLSEPEDRNGHAKGQGTRPKVTFGESNSETRKEDKKLSRQVNFGDLAPRHVNSDDENGEKTSEVVHVSSRAVAKEQVQPSSSAPLQPSPNPTFLQRVVMMPVESLIGCIPGASPLNPMGSASRRYGSNGDPVVPGSLIGSARSPAIQGQRSHGV